jgi:hypothetical protein
MQRIKRKISVMKLVVLLAFMLLSGGVAKAQDSDLGSWLTFSVDKGIVGNLGASFDQELRLKDNLTKINLLYTNIGVNYKFTKWFKLGLIYRFIDKHKSDGSWGLRNRYYADFIFKVKPGKFVLGYRARFQEEFRGYGYASDMGDVPEVYLRNLFKIGYKLNDKFTPYAGTELRWQFQNPRIPYHNGFDRSRFFAGTDYEIGDMQTFGAYFLFQKEWNVADPQTLYIIGLEYSLSID